MAKKIKMPDSYTPGEPLESEPIEEMKPEEIKVEEVEQTKLSAEDALDTVTLRVFVTLCGHKWDQMAGFVNYAQRTKLGPMSVSNWHDAYKEFQIRPVG